MAKKFTREQVQTLWSLAVANGLILKVEKASKVRVLAVRADAAGLVATKENRYPGQPINEGDWHLIAVDENLEPIPALEKGQQIYVYRNVAGELVQFDEQHASELKKEPLFDSWINTDEFFVSHYEVSEGKQQLGAGVARAKPTTNYAIQLAYEIEIETSWGAPATGSHWLVAYDVNPETLEVNKYDFNIVDQDAAERSYKLIGPATPTADGNK